MSRAVCALASSSFETIERFVGVYDERRFEKPTLRFTGSVLLVASVITLGVVIFAAMSGRPANPGIHGNEPLWASLFLLLAALFVMTFTFGSAAHLACIALALALAELVAFTDTSSAGWVAILLIAVAIMLAILDSEDYHKRRLAMKRWRIRRPL